MLTTLELANYRGFEKYRLGGLARVNLVVGKNNCGKTTVLEAVHLLAAGGDPSVLARFALQRGEVVFVGDERDPRNRREYLPDSSHFFFGHEFGAGANFEIGSDDGFGKITFRVIAASDIQPQQARLFEEATDEFPAYALQIEGNRLSPVRTPPLIPVAENGAFSIDRYRRSSRAVTEQAAPVQFISSDSLEPASMADMWDMVVSEKRELEVIKAMQILEPDLSDVFFLSGDRPARYGVRGGILIGFKNLKHRLPLGSQGGGMRRLLALSLCLIRSAGGILLIDEIDTGLHWSIMGDMWKLVVEAAQQANVQVVATTHSQDCLRGLAWLCENRADLASEISVQKVDRTLREAVALTAEQIRVAIEQGIEVR